MNLGDLHVIQIQLNNFRSSLFLGAATASLFGVTAQALADEPVETVVVTGSRIPNRDYSSDSPISTIAGENLKTQGAFEVTDLFNTLPQVVPTFSSGSNNPPSGGQENIDLRGIGANRTVVLMDGRRLVPTGEPDAAGATNTVDLQTIPQSLVARIEVVTGGESAVYGPDAIAGVVNFIMRDDFEGVEADAKYGSSYHGDDIQNNESLTIGGNFGDGKGNAVITYDYAYRKPIFDTARGFASQATSLTSYSPTGSFRPNSSNLPSQAAIDNYFSTHAGTTGPYTAGDVPNNNALGFNNLAGNGNNSLFNFGGGGTAGVFNYASSPAFVAKLFCPNPANHATCPAYSFNFQPPNLLVVPLQRHNFMGMAHYDILPHITVYASAKFTEYHADESLAPTPAPTSSVTAPDGSSCGFAFCVPDGFGGNTNPFIPADLQGILNTRAGNSGKLAGVGATEDFQMRTRFLQAGPRLEVLGNDIFQVTGGIKGEILPGYTFDLFASYGRADVLATQFGNISNSAVENLLYGKGSGACKGYGGLDPFGAFDYSAASLACVERTTKNSTTGTFTNIEGSVTGKIIDLPAGEMKFNIGADYIENTYSTIPDPLLISGDISGFNAAKAINGATYDKEVFSEIYVPLIKDAPWAESASLTFGGRYTSQSHTFHGNAWTWKVDGDWLVMHGITLRGSYQVATRMPNIGELFATSFQNNPELGDPCDFNGPFRTGPHAAQVQALCAAQTPAAGSANYVQPTGQITAISGGNPNLHPETADTYTLGVAYQSDFSDPWLSGVSATLDYWNIDLHGPTGVDYFDILYGCFNIDGSNPTYSNSNANCQRIVRSSGTGSVSYLNAFLANLSKYKINGIDLAVNWVVDLHDTIEANDEWGSLAFQWSGTYLNSYDVKGSAGGKTIDYAGTIGATSPIGGTTDGAIPKFKFQWLMTWNVPNAFDLGNAQLQTKVSYLDAMKNDLDRVGWTGFPFPPSKVTGVPATWYIDMFGSLDVTKNVTLRAGILNLGNQGPRLYNPSQQDGTDPTAYDIVGRRYFGGVTVKF